MHEKIEKLKPIAGYVHRRRGRFSAFGTFVVLYPWLRRPRHDWTEFEKDFRMYDRIHAKTQT
jgi:hypothetical protein